MLYEPTNITPSTLNGTGAVDAKDKINISWQVNGNSALLGYTIEIYDNRPDGRLVGSYTHNLSIPFYPKDQYGNIQLFQPQIDGTWESVFSIKNGKSYKYKIYQFYEKVNSDGYTYITDYRSRSFSVFNAYRIPYISGISVYNSKGQAIGEQLTTSIFTATTTYQQAQGLGLRAVRWQLYENGILVDDTGFIETADIKYTYYSAKNGRTYTLTYTVMSQSGQTNGDSRTFSVEYNSDSEYNPNFSAKHLCKEDAAFLSWNLDSTTSLYINGEATGRYEITTDGLYLPKGSSIRWDKIKNRNNPEESMNFSSPWTAIWKGKLVAYPSQILSASYNNINSNSVYASAYSPDGKVLVIAYSYYVAIWLTTGASATLAGFLNKDGNPTYFRDTETVSFSPDGKLLAIGGDGTEKASLFGVNGSTFTYIAPILRPDGQPITDRIRCSTFFSSSPVRLVLGGHNGFLARYDVAGTALSNGRLLYAPGTSSFDGTIYTVTALNTGFVVGGSFTGKAYQFGSGADALEPSYTITLNGETLPGDVCAIAFSSTYDTMILGGGRRSDNAVFSGLGIWKRSGLYFTYAQDIPVSQVPGIIWSLDFAKDDSSFLAAGAGTHPQMVYLTGTTVNAVKQVDSFKGDTCYVAKFNPQGDAFVLAGSFEDAKLYDNSSNTLFDIGEIKFSKKGYDLTVSRGSTNIATQTLPYVGENVTITLTPTGMVYESIRTEFTYAQPAIDNITLYGELTSRGIQILSNDDTVLFNATFLNGLQAGTGSDIGFIISSVCLSGSNTKSLILPSYIAAFRDFSLKSNAAYGYTFAAYDYNGVFVGNSTGTIPARQFQHHSLLATKYSEEDGCYHVYKQYQFGCNLQNMSVSNNANSSYVQNFTPYPTRMYSNANYASGTLQALIGFVDRQSYHYFDSTKLMDELNALSTADYVLFLKDMKGHIRMIAPNGAITQTVNIKSPQLEVTISFPWVEIGDASKVSIIQLPADEGWTMPPAVLDIRQRG